MSQLLNATCEIIPYHILQTSQNEICWFVQDLERLQLAQKSTKRNTFTSFDCSISYTDFFDICDSS